MKLKYITTAVIVVMILMRNSRTNETRTRHVKPHYLKSRLGGARFRFEGESIWSPGLKIADEIHC